MFNTITNEVDLFIPSIGSGLSNLAHELKHASQFENGDLSLPLHYNQRAIGAFDWLAYDTNDEAAADARSKLFGDQNTNSLSQKSLNRVVGGVRFGDRVQNYNIGTFTYSQTFINRQRIANAARQAFRVNGITYRPDN